MPRIICLFRNPKYPDCIECAWNEAAQQASICGTVSLDFCRQLFGRLYNINKDLDFTHLLKFETELAKATTLDTQDILGAVGIVINDKGETLYWHAAGRQSPDTDAPPLDPDSTVVLGSAGKVITNIAALQLVESGAVSLDESIYKHLPELETLSLITKGNYSEPFNLRRPTTAITLRHLLLHASGISNSDSTLVRDYLASDIPKPQIQENAHKIVQLFSLPLIFEPGQGFAYGNSIYWTQLLVTRLGGDFAGYIQEHIFEPLEMSSSTYSPQNKPEIWNRRLRMVERENGKLIPADDAVQGLTCSISDVGRALRDLISSSSTLLKKQEHIDLLLEGQFAPQSAALKSLRSQPDEYVFCAGQPGTGEPLSVNWCAAGLVVEEDKLPLSEMPKGTVTWEGMPNVMWAINKEKGLAMFFATQLVPVGDEKANSLALTFMKEAWNTFG